MKIIKNIVFIVIILLILSNFALVKVSTAAFSYSSEISTLETNASNASGNEITSTRRVVNAILSIVRVIAAGIAIIMLTVLAIKYMAAAPGDKAEIKKHAVVYVVGAIVLFAASGILGIIESFAGNIS